MNEAQHGALFVCFRSVLLVRARGLALRLGVCLFGFPAIACAVTPTTVASLCNNENETRGIGEREKTVLQRVLEGKHSVYWTCTN